MFWVSFFVYSCGFVLFRQPNLNAEFASVHIHDAEGMRSEDIFEVPGELAKRTWPMGLTEVFLQYFSEDRASDQLSNVSVICMQCFSSTVTISTAELKRLRVVYKVGRFHDVGCVVAAAPKAALLGCTSDELCRTARLLVSAFVRLLSLPHRDVINGTGSTRGT